MADIKKTLYVVSWDGGEFATDSLTSLGKQVREHLSGKKATGALPAFSVEEVECSLTPDEFYRAALGEVDGGDVDDAIEPEVVY